MESLANAIGGARRVIGGPFGSKLTQSDYVPVGIPVIRGGNMNQQARSISGSFVFVSQEKVINDLARNLAKPGDIIVTQRGTLGQVSIVPEDFEYRELVISQSQMAIKVDRTKADPHFVYYYLRSPIFADYVERATIQTGVPHINLGLLRDAPVEWPPLNQQRAIAAILSSLDDKIDLNHQTNETLEMMARSIFKDWFVDFSPTRAKMEEGAPYLSPDVWSLFPDRIDDEGKPEGWKITTVESIAERVAMGPFGSNIKVETFVDAGVPIISGQHLNGVMLADRQFNFVTDSHAAKLGNSNVQRGDIVFTHAGNIGQVSIIPETSRYERYILSQRQFFLRCDSRKVSPLFMIYFFRSAEGQHKLLANASQVGVPSIARPATNLKAIEFCLPSLAALKAFDATERMIHLKIGGILQETETLCHLRDFILPKLMSGEIRIKDAEELVEGVL
jgi:type I restriction enzyme S subunit